MIYYITNVSSAKFAQEVVKVNVVDAFTSNLFLSIQSVVSCQSVARSKSSGQYTLLLLTGHSCINTPVTTEPLHGKRVIVANVNSKVSGETAHLRSLTRNFTVHLQMWQVKGKFISQTTRIYALLRAGMLKD